MANEKASSLPLPRSTLTLFDGTSPSRPASRGGSNTDDTGWIDVAVCEAIVSKPIRFLLAVDGSDESMTALEYLANEVMQRDRDTYLQVLHVFDDSEGQYLPPACRKDALRHVVEAKLTGAVSAKRFRLSWLDKGGKSVGFRICEGIKDVDADYVCLGFVGRKGNNRDNHLMASNYLEVICMGHCGAIVFKDESPKQLPIGRPTKFVVSANLNKASTKAFLDVLRLSKPNDEIHVVYVRSYMEHSDSDYTVALRKKYAAFFEGLHDTAQDVFSKFHDRKVEFHMVAKQMRETIAQAVVRYADDVEADFIAVGTNAMRAERMKSPIGSVSLQICMETERNFIVAIWVDVKPALFDRHVRRNSLKSR